MSNEFNNKLSTDSYKGVRDFYPKDQAIQNYIFSIWKKTVEKFGYEEYNASILESSDLYKAKSGEEIVNEQTYSFKDRGDREVTLRPEMTPSVARMVAAKKRELAFPLRWYSIPNLFRYEQPQRGRLREHWQLNVDLFGVDNLYAEIEVIQIAYNIMRAYGLKDTDFEIRINNRKVMNYILKDVFTLSDEQSHALSKLIDRKNKMSQEEFRSQVEKEFANNSVSTDTFITLLNSKNFDEFTSRLPQTKEEHKGLAEIREIITGLENLGIRNAIFDQTLMRGFDYYTGVVFEVFDTNPENKRSVFGGGRYDELLSIFGNEKVSAVGFGAGDVIARDLLETYNLLPDQSNKLDLYICPTERSFIPLSNEIAQEAREAGARVAVDYTERKVGDKIKNADKNGARNVLCIGENEVTTDIFALKNLLTREETPLSRGELINKVLSS